MKHALRGCAKRDGRRIGVRTRMRVVAVDGWTSLPHATNTCSLLITYINESLILFRTYTHSNTIYVKFVSIPTTLTVTKKVLNLEEVPIVLRI